MNNYINLIGVISSVIAAIAAIISIVLLCKYQKINTIQEKTTSLQEFIKLSWSILNNFNLGSMNTNSSSTYVESIESEIKVLITLGLSIKNSKIYSNEIQTTVEEIYKLFKSCFDVGCNAEEIVKKIVILQDNYDNNIISKPK